MVHEKVPTGSELRGLAPSSPSTRPPPPVRESGGVRRRGAPIAPPCPAPARSRPASHPSPTDPVLRANPCPEVTDPICRLPLPTLFYRLEAVHLGDLLRIWVRPGTRITPSHQDFQGTTGVHRTPREARCFTGTTSLSPGKPIPGSSTLMKKRELFPGLPPTSPGSFASPHWTPRKGADLRVRVREY